MNSSARVVAACLGAVLTSGACAPERQYSEPPAASYSPKRFALADEDGASAGVDGAEVSAEFFAVAEVQPMLGRLFVDPDYRPAASPVALLSYRCWEERFGSAPDFLGRVINLNGRRRTVVGVLPRGFNFPKGSCVWVPALRVH